jgi:hypothetical protein
MGMTMKISIAGAIAAMGAIKYNPSSALRGVSDSLKNSFTPSASVCRMPNGPARLGPMRFCMSATIFRSIHTISITMTSRRTKAITTLTSAGHSWPPHSSPAKRSKRKPLVKAPESFIRRSLRDAPRDPIRWRHRG